MVWLVAFVFLILCLSGSSDHMLISLLSPYSLFGVSGAEEGPAAAGEGDYTCTQLTQLGETVPGDLTGIVLTEEQSGLIAGPRPVVRIEDELHRSIHALKI